MQERRSNQRMKTYIGGRIEQTHPLGSMDCIVREISPGGARIAFHNTSTVADRFTLVLPRKDRSIPASIAWRRFGEAGVRFDPAQSDALAHIALPTVSTEEKLRASEAKRRELQARLDRLNDGL